MLNRVLKSMFAMVIIAAILSRSLYGEPTAEKQSSDLKIKKDASTVVVSDGDRPVLRYRYDHVPMKPYIDQLFSPSGVQVLRDSPNDHKHHHAMMFAVAVEGVDFWSESGQGFGKEMNQSLVIEKWANTHHAGFTQQLDWIGPASGKPLLVESRTVQVLSAPDLGATLVQWRSSLQTPPRKDAATLTGSHYFGLGMRFIESMDSGGRFFNADDKQGEIVRGDEQLTPVKWCAYTAKADGKPMTVAIFDHPDNLRYPAKMFTMTKPFVYLSATRNEWKEPIKVEAGKPLNLLYGVALWDGEVDKATVEKIYQRWLVLSANGSQHSPEEQFPGK